MIPLWSMNWLGLMLYIYFSQHILDSLTCSPPWMIQWDDPHIIPADMTVEVAELFTRELTRVTQISSLMVIFGYSGQQILFLHF